MAFEPIYKRFTNAHTEHSLFKAGCEAHADIHWHDYHTRLLAEGNHTRDQLWGLKDEETIVRLRYIYETCMYRLNNQLFDPELNDRGNQIIRRTGSDYGADSRYKFDTDICPYAEGWRHFDTRQDASYFGIWVNVEKLMTVTYAEGDVTIVKCPDRAHLKAELEDMEKFYGPTPPAIICCTDIGYSDGKIVPKGRIEAFFDARPTVEV